jgi:hypothetical protein
VLLGVVSLTVLGGGYWLREESKEEALRREIHQAYEQQLGEVVDRYRSFRTEIEGWVVQAAEQGPPERYVDPRLRIAALHKGQGLYLRLRRDQARTAEGIEEGAETMEQDAITRCLGITPISMRGFYEKGDFLMPGWIDRAGEDEAGVMRLRVIDDELARYAERDLPGLLNMMQSQYLLLVIQDGETRATGPVDVYLYDLRDDQKLLSVRTEPDGVLIPVRISVPGAPPAPRVAQRVDSPGAFDCSIAAQVKELTGEPAMDFGSDPPQPEEPSEGEGEATEGEGAEGEGEATEDDTPSATPEAAATEENAEEQQ